MNAIMERWVGSVCRELLDRILIMNARHLRKVLAEYETHFNTHRPHRALNQASPLRALREPADADIKVTRRDLLGGLLHAYRHVTPVNARPDLLAVLRHSAEMQPPSPSAPAHVDNQRHPSQ
jgi:hypothetical protein